LETLARFGCPQLVRAIILAAAILTTVPSAAIACQVAADFTQVIATRPNYSTSAAPAKQVVPAHPSFFVHVGEGPGPSGMPQFTTADGTPIRIAKVVAIPTDDGWNLQRVDLDIDHGVIIVGFNERENDYRPTYTIDPTFVPRTRSVELLPAGMTLWVDSDAIAFRIEGQPFSPQQFNDGSVHVEPGKKQRVIALHSNGSEEVIYDGVPVGQDALAREWDCMPDAPAAPPDDEPVPPEVLILLFLGLAAFAPYATPRID
jgi:hypothetical protein